MNVCVDYRIFVCTEFGFNLQYYDDPSCQFLVATEEFASGCGYDSYHQAFVSVSCPGSSPPKYLLEVRFENDTTCSQEAPLQFTEAKLSGGCFYAEGQYQIVISSQKAGTVYTNTTYYYDNSCTQPTGFESSHSYPTTCQVDYNNSYDFSVVPRNGLPALSNAVTI